MTNDRRRAGREAVVPEAGLTSCHTASDFGRPAGPGCSRRDSLEPEGYGTMPWHSPRLTPERDCESDPEMDRVDSVWVSLEGRISYRAYFSTVISLYGQEWRRSDLVICLNETPLRCHCRTQSNAPVAMPVFRQSLAVSRWGTWRLRDRIVAGHHH
jgi:hypothetical protein